MECCIAGTFSFGLLFHLCISCRSSGLLLRISSYVHSYYPYIPCYPYYLNYPTTSATPTTPINRKVALYWNY